MIASLFLGLKEDLGVNFSAVKVCSSIRKCHIRQSFLPYSSNSLFNFARSILLAESINFRPLDNKEISGGDRYLYHHLQPPAQRVKSDITDTNHFLNKTKKIGKLADGAMLCTVDVVGLYPNIAYGEGIPSLYKFLETRENKQILSDTLPELAEIVFKNNIFKFNEKTFKQKHGTAIATDFVPPYAILYMVDLKEKLLEIFGKKKQLFGGGT